MLDGEICRFNVHPAILKYNARSKTNKNSEKSDSSLYSTRTHIKDPSTNFLLPKLKILPKLPQAISIKGSSQPLVIPSTKKDCKDIALGTEDLPYLPDS